jgi:hypothetical protein
LNRPNSQNSGVLQEGKPTIFWYYHLFSRIAWHFHVENFSIGVDQKQSKLFG